jgi:hypothetical protein
MVKKVSILELINCSTQLTLLRNLRALKKSRKGTLCKRTDHGERKSHDQTSLLRQKFSLNLPLTP